MLGFPVRHFNIRPQLIKQVYDLMAPLSLILSEQITDFCAGVSLAIHSIKQTCTIIVVLVDSRMILYIMYGTLFEIRLSKDSSLIRLGNHSSLMFRLSNESSHV